MKRKSIFSIILAFVLMCGCCSLLAACGKKQNTPVQMTTSYTYGRQYFNSVMGVQLPQLANREAFFDVGKDEDDIGVYFFVPSLEGNALTMNDFNAFKNYFDSLGWTRGEKETYDGSTYYTETYPYTLLEQKYIELTLERVEDGGDITSISMSGSRPVIEFDILGNAKSFITSIYGFTYPDVDFDCVSLTFEDRCIGLSSSEYADIDTGAAKYNEIKGAFNTYFTNLGAPWEVREEQIDANGKYVSYNNNSNGICVEVSYDEGYKEIYISIHHYGTIVATTFNQARQLFLDATEIEIPDYDNVTLGDNSFDMLLGDITFAFSSDDFDEDTFTELTAVFTEAFDEGPDGTYSGDVHKEWRMTDVRYTIDWDATTKTIDINVMYN